MTSMLETEDASLSGADRRKIYVTYLTADGLEITREEPKFQCAPVIERALMVSPRVGRAGEIPYPEATIKRRTYQLWDIHETMCLRQFTYREVVR
jgi:hypothetical protein